MPNCNFKNIYNLCYFHSALQCIINSDRFVNIINLLGRNGHHKYLFTTHLVELCDFIAINNNSVISSDLSIKLFNSYNAACRELSNIFSHDPSIEKLKSFYSLGVQGNVEDTLVNIVRIISTELSYQLYIKCSIFCDDPNNKYRLFNGLYLEDGSVSNNFFLDVCRFNNYRVIIPSKYIIVTDPIPGENCNSIYGYTTRKSSVINPVNNPYIIIPSISGGNIRYKLVSYSINTGGHYICINHLGPNQNIVFNDTNPDNHSIVSDSYINSTYNIMNSSVIVYELV